MAISNPFSTKERGETVYLKNAEVADLCTAGETFTVKGIYFDADHEYMGEPAPRWRVYVSGNRINGVITLKDNPGRHESLSQASSQLPIKNAVLIRVGQAYIFSVKA